METGQKIIYEKLKGNALRETKDEVIYEEQYEYIDSAIFDIKHKVGFDYEAPIISQKKGIGKLVRGVKKVIRKSLAWLIVPLLEEQTRKNIKFVEIMQDLTGELKLISREINEKDGAMAKRLDTIRQGLEEKLMDEKKNISRSGSL